MQVSELMVRDVLTFREDDPALKVGETLEMLNVGAGVVVKLDEVLGIISKETFFSKITTFCNKRIEDFKVKDLMEYDVACVNEEEDVRVACEKLLNSNSIIDRLPVLRDRRLTGLVSKQEFTRLFAETMKKKFKAKDLMSFDPVTVSDYTPLSKVVDEMMSSGVKRILVMSGSTMAGIIAVKDISLSLFREKKMCKQFNPVSILTAEDLMTLNPITVKGRDDAAKAAELMVEKSIGGLPVVDEGRIQGMLDRDSLLKGFHLTWE